MTNSGGSTNNPYGIQLWEVDAPGGSTINLQSQQEADWYERKRDQYMHQHAFSNVSDIQDLDRLLMLEVMVYRWSLWLGQGFDYLASRVDEKQLKDNIQQYSTEIRLVKKSLGIDKVTREADKGESVGDYITNLLQRAKEFGYHRNAQYEKAVTLVYQLSSMVRTHDRCDEEEREELDLSEEKILDWIREVLLPEFDQIDEDFRKAQTMWIRQL